MSDRTKMILGFAALISVALLFGLFIYFFLIKGTPLVSPEPEAETETTVAGALPASGESTPTTESTTTETEAATTLTPSAIASGGLTLTAQLTSSAIISPQLTVTGAIAYYDATDGRFYTIDENGNITQLSDHKFPSAEAVTFSSSSNVAAIEFPDGSNIIYDFATEEQISLPSHWEDFSFSPNEDEVASKNITTNANSRSITITSTDGTQTEVIAALGENEDDVTLSWSPNESIVGFSETGNVQSSFGRNEIFLIDTAGEAAGSIIVEGNNFSAKWSPSGTHLLYSVADAANKYRPSLWYVEASGESIGENRQRFAVETWAEKCTFFTETELYCAVPQEVPNFSGEDPKLVTAPDDVYLLNLNSGRATLVGTPAGGLQMFDLFVTADESILYFTDSSGKLNSMRLK